MICIVVDELISTKEKPYFALLYKEVGAKDYNIGYASYNLDVVVGYKNKYFEKVEYDRISSNSDNIKSIN